MGTLVIEEYAETGTQDDVSQPLARTLVKTTADATTSTSDETMTLDGRTRLVRAVAVSGAHRVNFGSSAGTVYTYIVEGQDVWLPAPAALGGTLAYRTDA